jgi:transcriptional regulator with XRE-family HTH domain
MAQMDERDEDQAARKELGRRLRHHRVAVGDPSLEEVGAAVGMSQSILSAYEKGKVWPPIPKLRRLAGFYGTTVGELLSSDWPTRASANAEPQHQAA